NKKILGVIVGAIGAITLILSGQANTESISSGVGNILILTAQFSFAMYLTLFRDLITKYSPVTISKWLFLYASLCFLPLSYNDLLTTHYNNITTNAWLQLGFVVFGATFLSYLLIMTAQKMLRPTLVSMYNNVQPIVATLLALALGMDKMGWDKGVAIMLVFIGVYIVTQSKSKSDLKNTP
ncbi:MAG: DMT family transporter, partial [Bacteroides sp.]|nr:DMT family transporter [Bacteroides sp.]